MPSVIKATPENAHLMREVIAGWPELNSCIKSLRKQGLFPGMRAMTLTDDAGRSLEQLALDSSTHKPVDLPDANSNLST
mgnify:CR=1 FL=1|jgi:hypothetical protein